MKATFDDLTINTARTPLAANRFKKFLAKAGPVAGGVLQKVVETIATEAARSRLGAEMRCPLASPRRASALEMQNEVPQSERAMAC